MPKVQVAFRIEESEFKLLKRIAKKTGRTHTDIIRELIRGLKDLENQGI